MTKIKTTLTLSWPENWGARSLWAKERYIYTWTRAFLFSLAASSVLFKRSSLSAILAVTTLSKLKLNYLHFKQFFVSIIESNFPGFVLLFQYLIHWFPKSDPRWSARLAQVVHQSLYKSIFWASRSTKMFKVVRAPEKFGNHLSNMSLCLTSSQFVSSW